MNHQLQNGTLYITCRIGNKNALKRSLVALIVLNQFQAKLASLVVWLVSYNNFICSLWVWVPLWIIETSSPNIQKKLKILMLTLTRTRIQFGASFKGNDELVTYRHEKPNIFKGKQMFTQKHFGLAVSSFGKNIIFCICVVLSSLSIFMITHEVTLCWLSAYVLTILLGAREK